jgi:hypothetical protein
VPPAGGAGAKKPSAAPGDAPYGFFCSLCRMGFHDTLALGLHKRSKKHREAAGLTDPEAEAARRRLPSVEELRAVIEAKAREQHDRRNATRGAGGSRPAKMHRTEA